MTDPLASPGGDATLSAAKMRAKRSAQPVAIFVRDQDVFMRLNSEPSVPGAARRCVVYPDQSVVWDG